MALREAAPAGPHLVVSPASVKRNWAREIEAVPPGASVRLISSPQQGALRFGQGG